MEDNEEPRVYLSRVAAGAKQVHATIAHRRGGGKLLRSSSSTRQVRARFYDLVFNRGPKSLELTRCYTVLIRNLHLGGHSSPAIQRAGVAREGHCQRRK